MNVPWIRLAAGAGLLSVAVAGCRSHHHHDDDDVVVAPAPVPAPAPAVVYTDEVADAPPPAPLVEVQDPPPGPDFVWIAGDWHYDHGRYAWEHGHWERRPRYGAEYHHPRWVRTERGWEHERGEWR